MISLKRAAEMGLERVTSPVWGGNAYLKLQIVAGQVRRITAFDYARGEPGKVGYVGLTMNAWDRSGQDFPFDAAGLDEERWLPFTGDPSPFEG